MSTINKAKYLSLLVLLGAWGCTTNQYVSRSGGYDDLYGGGPSSGVVTRDGGADQELSRSDNPDYSYTGDYAENGTSDYYDESYVTSRGVKRAVSTDAGYNAGFVDGYNRASSFNNFGGVGSYWPGSMMNLNFRFGYGNSFRIRPYLGMGLGFGSMYGYSPWGYSPWGYSPFGYGNMMAYGYDPFGFDPWGYGGMYGYGYYDSFYGGYGYSPWSYSRPVVVINNGERGVSRTYGPRMVSNSSRVRSAAGTTPPRSTGVTNGRGSRRASNAISANDSYVSPRSGRNYDRGSVTNPGGRSGSEAVSSRGTSEGNNVYYSRPRQSGGSTYSEANSGSVGRTYASPRSSRSGNTYSSPSYNVPSRSQSDYSSPSRTYTPSRSSESYSAPTRTYSAPTRTYSAPSYSAPSRSYSAPSSGGGGGATRSSSRGPR